MALPTLPQLYQHAFAELSPFLSSRFGSFFKALQSLDFRSARAAVSTPMPEEWQPKKKLDVVKRADPKLVRQVSRRTNLGVALRMSRRNFWLHFYHPLLTFLECERVYYSMYYVPRADSDVLSQKYHSL